MKKKILMGLSYVAVALFACLLTQYFVYSQIPSTKLIALEKLILELYPDEVDLTAIEDAAADAMVEAVGDRWSYYVPASDMEELMVSMENSYVGIGVTIGGPQEEGLFRVEAVVEGGPADQAGMRVDDIVLKVDGESVDGLTVEELAARVKGVAGTQVLVTVRRQGGEVDLTITRNPVNLVVAKGNLINGCIGYVRIENFVSRSAEETIAVIEELIAQGADRLLFDVRFNSGGYEHELVEILDYLLPEGNLISNADKEGKEENYFSDARCLKLPMVVLINEDSYSAAELFAADLHEYGAAKTVGSNTVGKGFYQNLLELRDGSAVNLSVGRYYTSKGENLEGIGLTPDVKVDMNDEDYARLYYGQLPQQEDVQLQAAVKLLMEE